MEDLLKDRQKEDQPKSPDNHLSFSDALNILKSGHKVQRLGWNGKGMWLKLIPASCNAITSDDMGDMVLTHGELPSDMHLLPWIGMKTVDDSFVPWLASQTDILADDWMIVE